MKTDAPGPIASSPPPPEARPSPARWWRAVAWIGLYLALVAAPLLMLLAGPLPKGGGRAWDFAMALGFGGLAVMGLQFVLTARFRRATAPFGIDIIYYFHRYAALVGIGLVVAHYAILRVGFADAVGPANPLAAPWHMTAGRVSLGLFVVLIVSSLGRKLLRIEYDGWRIGHAVMAVVAMVLAIVHIMGVGHYTAAAWRGTVWTAYSALWLMVAGYIRGWRPWVLRRHPYRVTSVRPERGRSWTVTLEPEGHPVLRFRPGQFAWVTLGTSPFRAREHPFSFSGSAADSRRLQFTIKELGDFTRTIKEVTPGTIAYVDGPHGVFSTDHFPSSPGFVFVAGGVGIAPVMSMLRTLADRGDRRPLLLIHGCRSWDDCLFREEVQELQSRLTLSVFQVLQEPPPGWSGGVGVLSEEVIGPRLAPLTASQVFFLCGPKPMADAVQQTLRRRGVPLGRIQTELFDMA
ncbi:MAG: ferric reductase-like transmembrane domain-containing protein [Opitutaceae bacterium]|nr:ferric reductase-like transmembrane domain-containing protein [Opitutaceae bacterium]